jgi:hypothetical protein
MHPTLDFADAMLPTSLHKSQAEASRRRSIATSQAARDRRGALARHGGFGFGFDTAVAMDPAVISPIVFGAPPGSAFARSATGRRQIRALVQARLPASGDGAEAQSQRIETTRREIWSEEAFGTARFARLLATVEHDRWCVRDRVHLLTTLCNLALETERVRAAVQHSQRDVQRRDLLCRTSEINDEWWDYVSPSDVATTVKAARLRAERSYHRRCEKVVELNAANRAAAAADRTLPKAPKVARPAALPPFKIGMHGVANVPCALCGQKLDCFTKYEGKKAPSFVCMDIELGVQHGLHPELTLVYSKSLLKCLGMTVVKPTPNGDPSAVPAGAVAASAKDANTVRLGREHEHLRPDMLPTFVHECCVHRLSEKSSDWLQTKKAEQQRWKQCRHRVEFLGRSTRGTMLWVVPRSVNRTDPAATPVPMILMQFMPPNTPRGAVGWACLRTQEHVRPLLSTAIRRADDAALYEKVTHVMLTMLTEEEDVADPAWERPYYGSAHGVSVNRLGEQLAAERHLRAAHGRAVGQLRPPEDTRELGCSVGLWSIKEKAKALVWALPPSAFNDGEVRFLLFTVTFYANHAHNLTRSP